MSVSQSVTKEMIPLVRRRNNLVVHNITVTGIVSTVWCSLAR